MAYTIDRVNVFSGSVKDQPGGLAALLAPLSDAGANLEFVFARRDKAYKGLVFLAPIKGAKQAAAAKKLGLKQSETVQALCITGPDKAGLGAKLTCTLAEAGISLRGLSATAIGKKCVIHLAFDSKADAAKAKQILAKAL